MAFSVYQPSSHDLAELRGNVKGDAAPARGAQAGPSPAAFLAELREEAGLGDAAPAPAARAGFSCAAASDEAIERLRRGLAAGSPRASEAPEPSVAPSEPARRKPAGARPGPGSVASRQPARAPVKRENYKGASGKQINIYGRELAKPREQRARGKATSPGRPRGLRLRERPASPTTEDDEPAPWDVREPVPAAEPPAAAYPNIPVPPAYRHGQTLLLKPPAAAVPREASEDRLPSPSASGGDDGAPTTVYSSRASSPAGSHEAGDEAEASRGSSPRSARPESARTERGPAPIDRRLPLREQADFHDNATLQEQADFYAGPLVRGLKAMAPAEEEPGVYPAPAEEPIPDLAARAIERSRERAQSEAAARAAPAAPEAPMASPHPSRTRNIEVAARAAPAAPAAPEASMASPHPSQTCSTARGGSAGSVDLDHPDQPGGDDESVDLSAGAEPPDIPELSPGSRPGITELIPERLDSPGTIERAMRALEREMAAIGAPPRRETGRSAAAVLSPEPARLAHEVPSPATTARPSPAVPLLASSAGTPAPRPPSAGSSARKSPVVPLLALGRATPEPRAGSPEVQFGEDVREGSGRIQRQQTGPGEFRLGQHIPEEVQFGEDVCEGNGRIQRQQTGPGEFRLGQHIPEEVQFGEDVCEGNGRIQRQQTGPGEFRLGEEVSEAGSDEGGVSERASPAASMGRPPLIPERVSPEGGRMPAVSERASPAVSLGRPPVPLSERASPAVVSERPSPAVPSPAAEPSPATVAGARLGSGVASNIRSLVRAEQPEMQPPAVLEAHPGTAWEALQERAGRLETLQERASPAPSSERMPVLSARASPAASRGVPEALTTPPSGAYPRMKVLSDRASPSPVPGLSDRASLALSLGLHPPAVPSEKASPEAVSERMGSDRASPAVLTQPPAVPSERASPAPVLSDRAVQPPTVASSPAVPGSAGRPPAGLSGRASPAGQPPAALSERSARSDNSAALASDLQRELSALLKDSTPLRAASPVASERSVPPEAPSSRGRSPAPAHPPRAPGRAAPALPQSAPGGLAVMQAPQKELRRLRRNLSVGAYGAGLLQPGLSRSASADPGPAARPRVQQGEGGGPAYMQPRRRGYRAEKSRERAMPASAVSQEAAGAMLGAYSAPRQKARAPRPPPAASQPDVSELQARVARKAAALQQLGAQTSKLAAQLGKLTSPAKIPPPV